VSKSVIEIKDLTKHFKVPVKTVGFGASLRSLFVRKYKTVKAVEKISFSIEEGEMVGFLGPNGAGKTTTLKMMAGILYPTSGTAQVLGYTPSERKRGFQQKISMVMGQKNQLWWDLPATEAYELNKEIYGIPTPEFKETLSELIALLSVEDILQTPVRKLSLGQRMKCELIASLLHRPKVLFLDEPTIGLDLMTQKKVREFLREINRKTKTTVILTSHYMEDVEAICDRVIMIDKGQKLYDGSIKGLIAKYGNEKYLQIDFDSPVDRQELEEIGRVVEYEGVRATFAVSRKDHTALAAKILTKYKVDNLDIQEVKLEDIILKHFSGQK